jgi:hypothetical protein
MLLASSNDTTWLGKIGREYPIAEDNNPDVKISRAPTSDANYPRAISMGCFRAFFALQALLSITILVYIGFDQTRECGLHFRWLFFPAFLVATVFLFQVSHFGSPKSMLPLAKDQHEERPLTFLPLSSPSLQWCQYRGCHDWNASAIYD